MKLKILVQPNAKKNEVVGLHADSVKLKIKALPVDGAANKAVIDFFSEMLSIPKKKIRITSGESSRNKVIELETELTAEQVLGCLLKK